MPRGVKLTHDECQLIIDLLPSGKSRNAIAKETGFSHDTVARLARSVGHRFGQQNLAHAREVAKAYGAEWRADFAKRLSAKCDDLLGDMDGEYLVFNFGGRDNDYCEHTLAAPPTEAKERLVKSIRLAVQTILDIDRHDSQGADTSAVEAWVEAMKGNPV